MLLYIPSEGRGSQVVGWSGSQLALSKSRSLLFSLEEALCGRELLSAIGRKIKVLMGNFWSGIKAYI